MGWSSSIFLSLHPSYRNKIFIVSPLTDLIKGDFMKLMQAPNDWNNYITQVQQNLIQTSFNCPYDCGLFQWATGGVTKNLPRGYFNQNYSSLWELYPTYFSQDGVIGEFYGYAKAKLGQELNWLPEKITKAFYHPGVGGLNNYYEFARLIAASLKGDQTYINGRFNSSGVSNISSQFLSFLRYLVYNNYISITKTVTANDLLWGYTDANMANMVMKLLRGL